MANYDKFVGGPEMLEGFAFANPLRPKITESDMASFDPYLNPNFPFYKKRRPYYINDYGF